VARTPNTASKAGTDWRRPPSASASPPHRCCHRHCAAPPAWAVPDSRDRFPGQPMSPSARSSGLAQPTTQSSDSRHWPRRSPPSILSVGHDRQPRGPPLGVVGASAQTGDGQDCSSEIARVLGSRPATVVAVSPPQRNGTCGRKTRWRERPLVTQGLADSKTDDSQNTAYRCASRRCGILGSRHTSSAQDRIERADDVTIVGAYRHGPRDRNRSRRRIAGTAMVPHSQAGNSTSTARQVGARPTCPTRHAEIDGTPRLRCDMWSVVAHDPHHLRAHCPEGR
jgi:hypothetical protein